MEKYTSYIFATISAKGCPLTVTFFSSFSEVFKRMDNVERRALPQPYGGPALRAHYHPHSRKRKTRPTSRS